MKKYELLQHDTVTTPNGIVLYRIRALKDLAFAKKGDLGGYIEKEDNLSHLGDAWVADNAWVCENAIVADNAVVYENARVYGNAWIRGNAVVSGNARVFENAEVYEKGRIFGSVRVLGDAKVYGFPVMTGDIQQNTSSDSSPVNIEKEFELENSFEIWDNKLGSRIVLRKDRDGLGLNEIVYFTEKGEEHASITLTDGELNLLGGAIARKRLLENVENPEK